MNNKDEKELQTVCSTYGRFGCKKACIGCSHIRMCIEESKQKGFKDGSNQANQEDN